MTLVGVGLDDFGRWVSAGGIVGMLALLIKFYLENRKLKLQERHEDRDGYGVLIQALQADVVQVREQHRECESRLTEVEAQLRGVHRQLVMQSSNAAINLAPPSDDVMGAARRARKIAEEGE